MWHDIELTDIKYPQQIDDNTNDIEKNTYKYFYYITDTFVSIYANRIDRDYEKRANERKTIHKLTENELKKIEMKMHHG